jgi:hypothetical protein
MGTSDLGLRRIPIRRGESFRALMALSAVWFMGSLKGYISRGSIVKRMGSAFVGRCLKSEKRVYTVQCHHLGQPNDGILGNWACYLICFEVGNGVTFPCLDI